MRLSSPWKAVIVAVPAAAWIAQTQPSLPRALALAAGAACCSFAWIVLSPSPRAAPAPTPVEAAGACSAHQQRHGETSHGITRTPTGRGPRDLRCPASPPMAPARRATRR